MLIKNLFILISMDVQIGNSVEKLDEKGFLDLEIDPSLDLFEEIEKMKIEKLGNGSYPELLHFVYDHLDYNMFSRIRGAQKNESWHNFIRRGKDTNNYNILIFSTNLWYIIPLH